MVFSLDSANDRRVLAYTKKISSRIPDFIYNNVADSGFSIFSTTTDYYVSDLLLCN